MKTTLIFSLFSILNLSSFSQSVEDLDRANGFLQYKLGSNPVKLKGFEKTEEIGPVQVYVTMQDSLTKLGPYKMESIALFYYNNHLWKIDLVAPGEENARGIANLLMAAYGEKYKTFTTIGKSDMKSFVYTGEKVELVVTVDFNFVSSKFEFTSIELDKEYYSGSKKTTFTKEEQAIIEKLKN